VLLAAAATVEVETKLEAEVEADLEASVTEDDNDMACKWRRLLERCSTSYFTKE